MQYEMIQQIDIMQYNTYYHIYNVITYHAPPFKSVMECYVRGKWILNVCWIFWNRALLFSKKERLTKFRDKLRHPSRRYLYIWQNENRIYDMIKLNTYKGMHVIPKSCILNLKKTNAHSVTCTRETFFFNSP